MSPCDDPPPVVEASASGGDASPAGEPSRSLPKWIFLGLLGGLVAGLVANRVWGPESPGLRGFVANLTEPIGQLFLRLLLMIVVPLVFSSLLLGVAGVGNVRKLGRVGVKSFAYCLLISVISVGLALALTNAIEPGKRVNPRTAAELQARYGSAAEQKVAEAKGQQTSQPLLTQVVTMLVPKNPVTAIASETPNILHLMFFSLLLGVGITLLAPGRAATFLGAVEGLYAISTRLIDLIMWLAPVAVACLVFTNIALFGLDLLAALGWFILTVIGGLALHLFVVYSVLLKTLSRLSPLDFFRRIKLVMLTAFSTSSSNATLPTTLRVAEKNLGVPRDIGSFVLTVGATANQNGTALYEGATVLFIAQLAGIDLSLGQQITVAGLAVLGSIGTAGVPSGSIPFIVLVLANLQINPALIAIILGVDRFLDMCRTVVNVTGDLTAATFVARSEGSRLAPPEAP